MVVTLLFFVAGSVAGTFHSQSWSRLPAFPPVSLLQQWGLGPALLAQLSLFVLIWLLSLALEQRRCGSVAREASGTNRGWRSAVIGPWPLAWGAVGLALLNFATLALAGRPWGVTSAFVLWGSKAAAAAGIDVHNWPYWAGARSEAIRAGILFDITSVMNIGILCGALLGAGLAGRFSPRWRIEPRSLLAAAVGGLLLGYGARMAFGCNVGALLAGIASSSLHGWVWFASALSGTAVGVRLRPWFGLSR